MNTLIKEYPLKAGYRVIMERVDFSLPYRISSQQHYTTHTFFPGYEHDENGWRDCYITYAASIDEANQEYGKLIESEMRYV